MTRTKAKIIYGRIKPTNVTGQEKSKNVYIDRDGAVLLNAAVAEYLKENPKDKDFCLWLDVPRETLILTRAQYTDKEMEVI